MLNATFKTSWNPADHSKAKRAILKHFAGNTYQDHTNKRVYFPHAFSQVEGILGLPYTSSSYCAMLSMNCNVLIECPVMPGYHYEYTAITEDNKVYFSIQDKEEHEIFIEA